MFEQLEEWSLFHRFDKAHRANSRCEVMERLGMQRSPADDFAHPELPDGHRLRPHVLYRLSRQRWAAMAEVGS